MSMSSDSIPSDALVELMSPGGYYTYLEIEKTVASEATSNADNSGTTPLTTATGPTTTIDEEAVKKAYRRLSRKHHPDKPGGDADTFRMLNRAQKVLLNPKLRHQYDILGIDLDDDEAIHGEEHDNKDEKQDEKKEDPPSTAQGIVHEIASMVLTGIIQLAVRTVMMGVVAVVFVNYRITLYPALLFLTYICFQILSRARLPGGSMVDALPPLLIATGLVLMHYGRSEQGEWSYRFWAGEALVICMFTYNSATAIPKNALTLIGLSVFSILAALWFRGNIWNYAIVIGMEAFMALFVAMAFPIMELILETILTEKLRKVGDKVRAHHQQLEAYYKAKLEQKR